MQGKISFSKDDVSKDSHCSLLCMLNTENGDNTVTGAFCLFPSFHNHYEKKETNEKHQSQYTCNLLVSTRVLKLFGQ